MRRAGTEGSLPPPLTGISAASTSTLRPVRTPSPEQFLASPTDSGAIADRPRSSSFSVGPTSPSSQSRHDSDVASIFSNATHRGLSLFTNRAERMVPHRTHSANEKDAPQTLSPITSSPSLGSVHAASGKGAPRNLYDSTQMKAAIEKFENAHKPDVKGGELGSVGAVGFGGDDAWQTVTVKVLPLWNNDPLSSYIEDVRFITHLHFAHGDLHCAQLNEIVQHHIKRIIERTPTHAIAYLTEHFEELLSTGMLTLSAKLTYLADEDFLHRLDEVWVSFFSRILPYLEAIFLPFSTNAELQGLHAGHTLTGRAANEDPIPVRRLALMAFRDQILLPSSKRLISLFGYIASVLQPDKAVDASRRASHSSTVSSGHTPNASHYRHTMLRDAAMSNAGRRTQMISLVVSARTGDDKQETVETMLRALRGDIDMEEVVGQETASPIGFDSDDEELEVVGARQRSTVVPNPVTVHETGQG